MNFEISNPQREELKRLISLASEAQLSLVRTDPELADRLRMEVVIVKEMFQL